MFGIGGIELLLIAIFGFLIIGPEKLPQMAKTLGKALSKFKGAQVQMQKVIKEEIYNPEKETPLDAVTKVANKASSGAAAEKGRAVSKARNEVSADTAGATATTSAADTAGATATTSAADTNAAGANQSPSFSARKAAYEQNRAAQSATQGSSNSSQAKKEGE